MKNIVIFCRTIDKEGYPFNHQYYKESYQQLILSLKRLGAGAYFATDKTTYKGDGLFSTAYTVDEMSEVADFKKVNDVRADVILEKGGFTDEDVLVINPKYIHEITNDKNKTYELFARYQPLSFICRDFDEVKEAFTKLVGEMVVVKEPEGNGGHQIYIGKKSEIYDQVPDRFPLMVQEFIDDFADVEGLVEGPHDIRVLIAGGSVIGGQLRIPAKGELKANMSQGASQRLLYPEEIPTNIKALALEIDSYFKADARYISADFANTKRGIKLVELNSKPGLTATSMGGAADYITEKVAEYLISL